MVAAGEGLRVGQAKVASTFGRDVMIVFAGRTSMQAGGSRAGRRIRFDDVDLPLVREKSPDCKYIIPELGQGNILVHSSHNSGSLTVAGSAPPFAEVRSIDVGEGRFYNDEDLAQARHVAFIGTDIRKQLFPGRPAVGETIYLADIPYTVIGVGNVSQIDGLADRRATWKQLLANVSPDECYMAGLCQILIIVEAAFADIDGTDLREGRCRARYCQGPGIVGAVNQDVSLPQLGDDVLAVGRFLAHERQVDIIETYAPPRPAASRLHAGASGKYDHHVTAEGAGHLCLTDAQALASGHHQHNRDDPPRNATQAQKSTQLVP